MLEDKYDIFLSYSSKDEQTADRIYHHLSSIGYKVWKDSITILTGDDIVQKVFDGIKKSQYFAILLTHNSTESKWVKDELSAARIRELEDREVVILPLLYEDCNIPASLSSKKYADFRRSFEHGINALINSLINRNQERKNDRILQLVAESQSNLDENKTKLANAINGSENLYLVMDLGGTKAYVSLVNSEAERLFDRKFATESHENSNKLFSFVKTCIRETIDDIHEICDISTDQVTNRIKAFGIAFPGPTDFERGLILDAANFQIVNFPLTDMLEKNFRIQTFVDNDVNLGVLGESWKGVAKGYKNVVGIIIGTGIGGGIIIDGSIYRGKNKTAGEIGHLILDFNGQDQCGCGQFGCFEALASRRAMGRNLQKRKVAKGENNLIWKERNLGSNEIADHFKNGDKDAIEIVNNAAKICGKAVFSILNLLNPDIIFFGGGFVRQLGDVFLNPVREEAKKCMNAVYSLGDDKDIPIKIGILDNPILIGACKMILDNTSEKKTYSKSSIIDAVVNELSERDLTILLSFYQSEKPILISKDPRSDFYEDQLRKLRNRGLIQSVGNQSFRKSTHVQITDLGRIIVEERL